MTNGLIAMWLLNLASAALVWTMPAGAEQTGAWTIVALQMMAVCLMMIGHGLVFVWRNRAVLAQILRETFAG